jgi:hypothetical protein
MRKFFMIALVVIAMGVFATSALALEKSIARAQDLDPGWNATNTVRVQYYNTCVGYIWLWTSWAYEGDGGETWGITYDGCTTGSVLAQTQVAFYSALPQGYGYTGTISVLDGTQCNSPVLDTQVFNPITGTAFNLNVWNTPVSDPFMVAVTMASPDTLLSNSGGMAFDIMNPISVPGSPDPCAVCNVVGRAPHTYYFGVGGSICSGTLFFGSPGSCVASEAQVVTDLKCVVSVEEKSWGKIKNLYQ